MAGSNVPEFREYLVKRLVPCLRQDTRVKLERAIADEGSSFGLLPGELRTIERLMEIIREVPTCD